jgi:mono/diheme cytochrome c family protein
MPRSIVAFAVAATFIAGAASAAESTPIQRGRDLVARNCSMCHAIGPTGDSPLPAAPRFRELHERYPVENLAEAMAEGIVTGHPQMPEFLFYSWEVHDIIAYLKSIQTKQPASTPSAPAVGPRQATR